MMHSCCMQQYDLAKKSHYCVICVLALFIVVAASRPVNKNVSIKPCPHCDFGDYSRRKQRQFVAEFGNCVAENGDCRRIRQQSPKSATIVASVDRTYTATVSRGLIHER